tara:strand:- start:391 stop:678 length:288 start_codon:yes stop_codon:yes gene_type:complete
MITKDLNNNPINFSIDTLDEMLKAKRKTKKVIESCKTNKQLDGAKKLIVFYQDRTQDMVGGSELELDVLYRRREVEDDRFTKKDWNKLIKKWQND